MHCRHVRRHLCSDTHMQVYVLAQMSVKVLHNLLRHASCSDCATFLRSSLTATHAGFLVECFLKDFGTGAPLAQYLADESTDEKSRTVVTLLLREIWRVFSINPSVFQTKDSQGFLGR